MPLVKYIQCTDTAYEDQVWITLTCAPNIEFGGCYIAPSDSPYFNENIFAEIQRRCMENTSVRGIIFGYYNARWGQSISSLCEHNQEVTYVGISANVKNSNQNEKRLFSVMYGL